MVMWTTFRCAGPPVRCTGVACTAQGCILLDGAEFRWAGLGKGKLQWDVQRTDLALTNFRREPADAIENFDRKPQPAAG